MKAALRHLARTFAPGLTGALLLLAGCASEEGMDPMPSGRDSGTRDTSSDGDGSPPNGDRDGATSDGGSNSGDDRVRETGDAQNDPTGDGGVIGDPNSAEDTGDGDGDSGAETTEVDNGLHEIATLEVEPDLTLRTVSFSCVHPGGNAYFVYPPQGTEENPYRHDRPVAPDGEALLISSETQAADGQIFFPRAVYDCDLERRWTLYIDPPGNTTSPKPSSTAWALNQDRLHIAQARSGPEGNYLRVFERASMSDSTEMEDVFETSQTRVAINAVHVAGSGTYVTGTTQGQLPANPPEASNGPFAAYYENGARRWVRQEVDIPGQELGGVMGSDVDAEGNLYEGFQGATSTDTAEWLVQKLNDAGERQWLSRLSFPLQGAAASSSTSIALDATDDGKHVFLLLHTGAAPYHSTPTHLVKLDAAGRFAWSRELAVNHSLVIDDVEGTIWEGPGAGAATDDERIRQSAHAEFFAVSDQAVYLVGSYNSSFRNGSNPPPGYGSAFIAMVDFKGSEVWTRLYRGTPLEVNAGASGSSASTLPYGIRVLASGDVAVAVTHQPTGASAAIIGGADGEPR